MQYLINNRLYSEIFSQGSIAKIIQSSDFSKVYRHDNISIRMLKLCVPAILKPLAKIFK